MGPSEETFSLFFKLMQFLSASFRISACNSYAGIGVVYMPGSRLMWKIGLWACVCEVILTALRDMGRLTSTVGSPIPWQGMLECIKWRKPPEHRFSFTFLPLDFSCNTVPSISRHCLTVMGCYLEL